MRLLGNLIDIYLLLVIGRILLSWFPISPESPMSSVFSFLYRLTEPVLGPIRRLLPPIGMGGMALDLSPIIVIFGLEILKNALVR
ncbi:MAG TPA: YggT family protein [Acidimicrobiales bacterium]|nr:YggT family protein [Acidimicrobiales bacterium]